MPVRPEEALLEWESSAATADVVVRGAWTLGNYAHLKLLAARYREQLATVPLHKLTVDFHQLAQLDTVGALCLYEVLGAGLLEAINSPACGLSPARSALLRTVIAAQKHMPEEADAKRTDAFFKRWLGRIGLVVTDVAHDMVLLLGFVGITLAAFARDVFRPWKWRMTSVVAQLELIGLDAVPIVALLTFMVGAVVAFLGATILDDFGATIYTVDLVGFSFLREFAVILTAILLAGRTASAFTAQIGSMKVNEEIDAIRMTGLDPIDLLVMPRILAMLVALPLLTFIGMVSGIFGGMLVSALSLDISPTMFLSVFKEDIALRHFFLGMAKAPVFAYTIALIGCLEGFKVEGSAQSVGQHTTSAVVQSIFLVILIDAVAALFYMEMGW